MRAMWALAGRHISDWLQSLMHYHHVVVMDWQKTQTSVLVSQWPVKYKSDVGSFEHTLHQAGTKTSCWCITSGCLRVDRDGDGECECEGGGDADTETERDCGGERLG